MLTHPRRLLATIATIALSVSALGGCQAGQAARVGNERIAENTVSQVVDELPRVTGQGSTQSTALASLLISSAINQAAAESGIVLSNDDVRAKLAELGIDPQGLSDETLQVAGASLLDHQIAELPQAEKINERINEIVSNAEVNPRYGIDVENGAHMPQPAWFVTPQ